MKATITLKQLNPIFVALQHLGEKEMPIKSSFLVSRLTTMLEPDVQALQEARLKFIEKYAVRERGQQVVKGDAIPKFQAEMAALEATEITVEIEKLSLAVLEQAGVMMAPQDLSALLPFLEIQEADEKGGDDA